MKFPIYILCLLLLSNCSRNSYQKKIIENHNRIAANLENSAYSHYRRGGGEAVIFNTFKERNENFYFFEVTNGTLILKKRNIQFKEITKRNNVTNYVLNLEKQLDSLDIKGYDGQPDGLGVLLELNMNDGSTIIYTEDTSRISYPLTLAYIRKAKPLCNNWYYSKDWY